MAHLHKRIEQRLASARESLIHTGTKGDASEAIWLDLLKTYLPTRYSVTKGHVCDSKDNFSDQIDIIVYDRQYSPLIFTIEGQTIVPAESVYAVFEAKQVITAGLLRYAQDKAASVRRLYRTSMPIPHAGGTYEPRDPPRILAGFLALDSEWKPPMGSTMIGNLKVDDEQRRLELGCIAAHGHFLGDASTVCVMEGEKAATAFLFELIAQLQQLATVPMIDIRAYAAWLDKVE
ncbi:DUF6602 domain-containing protein [Sinorhizobium meliloti]|uniref:DUF6602 domain-containing protein n=1 Tax=Rhizobium meliloti TaxID=382 RepID=UPI000FD724E3|nr:DUF6602 domain-containing protein [Sinorhizobium meliloti]RVH17258.1 hypothetical protein CN215_32180 [Sinorhizobium meliloti]